MTGVREGKRKFTQAVSYAAAVLIVAGAGAYMILSPDKGLGIFFVLLAAELCRLLVIDLGGWLDRPAEEE